MHKHTIKFFRFAERNKLMEIEGQWIANYLDGLRLAIRKKIGVYILFLVFKARN